MTEFFTKEIALFGKLFSAWQIALIALIVLVIIILLIFILLKKKPKEGEAVVQITDTAAKDDETERAPKEETVVEELEVKTASKEETVVEELKVKTASKEETVVGEAEVEPASKEETVVGEAEVEPASEEETVEEVEVEPASEEETVEEVEVEIASEEEVEEEVKAEPASEEEDALLEDEEEVVEKEEVKIEPVVAAVKKEPATKTKKVTKKAVVEPKKNVARGKFEISLRSDGYHFSLIANNGQLLYDSFGFASLQGAKGGIETFKRSVEDNNFTVYKDKFDRFRYVLNKRYVGENYTNKTSCENSVNSVKRFALNAVITDYVRDEKAEKQFEEFKKNMTIITDEEWAVEIEKEYKPSGKYDIDKEDDGFHFYLIANNGQLLYSSRSYTTADGAVSGINSFKRAVFSANFYIDEDKFGKFRFIVRGGGNLVYVGESFSTKKSAVSNAESVKNFAMSAVIVPYTEV